MGLRNCYAIEACSKFLLLEPECRRAGRKHLLQWFAAGIFVE